MEHKFINYLTTIILSILFPMAHQNFQSPRASGRPLKTHPALGVFALGMSLFSWIVMTFACML